MDLGSTSLRVLTVEDRLFLEIARKNGLLGEGEARRAIEEVAVRKLRLEAALFHLGLLDERQLKRVREAMAASQVVRLDSLFGDIVLELRLVEPAELEAAFVEQRRQRFRVRVGGVLLERGLLNPDTHREVINLVIRRIKRDGIAAVPKPGAASESLDEDRLTSSEDLTEPLEASPPEPQERHLTEPLKFNLAETLTEPLVPAPPQVSLPSERATQIMGPDTVADAGLSIPLHSVDELRALDGYLATNLDSLERGSSADYVAYEERPAEPTDDCLIASALRIGIESGDPLRRSDERFLRADLARASGDDDENFVLDRGEITASDETAGFGPGLGVARKRRSRSLKLVVGLGVGALLLGVIGFGGVALGNKRILAQVRELLERAEGAASPADRRRLYLEAGETLSRAGGLGVSDDVRRRLSGLIRWGKLEAEALEDLAESPQQVAQLLERRSADVPESAKDDYQELLRRARRAGRLAAGRRAESRGEFAAAVVAYRDAQNSGDPKGLVRQELLRVREQLIRQMDTAYKLAELSLSAEDERRFQEAAKLFQELYNVDPGAAERLEELSFQRAIKEGVAFAGAGALDQALDRLQEAAELRPGDLAVREELRRVQDLIRLRDELRQGEAAEELGDLELARESYRRALALASADERERIREHLARLEAVSGERDQVARQRELRSQTVAALRDSRIDEALELAGQLVEAAPGDAQAKALRDFAEQVRGMVFVAGGPFLMGSQAGPGVDPLEVPQHTVELPAFFIGRGELTHREYAEFVRARGVELPAHWRHRLQEGAQVRLTYAPELSDHPVVHVSWADAVAYARWRGVRLPSESQWEKAARGTQGQTYPWGEGTRVKAHIDVVPDRRRRAWGTAATGAHADDSSPCGAVDMGGNVNEWTSSRLTRYPDAPREAKLPRERRRVLKGGAYPYSFAEARCASREGAREDYRSREVGFRIAQEIPQELRSLLE